VNTDRHLATFTSSDGELVIGGVPLRRLAERVGSTPFFAYDRDRISERVADVRAALPPGIELGYAVKANPMPAVVQHLSRLVDSLDVASAGEMAVALDTGMDPGHVSFAGPGKTDEELRRAVAAGVLVEAESTREVLRVARIGEQLSIAPRLAIRVNPDFVVKGSGMRMSGGPQQFGVDAESVGLLMSRVAGLGLELEGFHIFAGSQNLQADILAEAMERVVDLAVDLAKEAPAPIRYLNLGGGLGIPYFEKDEPLDLRRIGDTLGRLESERIRPVLGNDVTVMVELGRYLVGEAGVYVTRVVDRKESRGRTYVVVDGGMHHQLAASGNFGQVIRRNYPVTVGDRLGEAEEEVTVVGCLCTPLDLLADRVRLPTSFVGDLVVIFQAGAYGLTASPTRFLGHPAPAELLV
jgi:diaminopimelate decarboxylase